MKVVQFPRPGYGWGKAERLRKHNQFCHVQNKGRRIGGKFIVLIFTPSSILYPRFGITVSKKCGHAVVRNKIKRRLRDILRHTKATVVPADYVLIARSEAAQASFEAFRDDVQALFERVERQQVKSQSH